jgi:hypothetical protein
MDYLHIPILRRTTITLPAVAASAEVRLPPLAELIDTSGWASGTLEVRVFDVNFTGASAQIGVGVGQNSVGPDDPSRVFIGEQLALLLMTTNTADSTLLIARLPTPDAQVPELAMGRYIGVYVALVGNPSGITAGGTITIAVDLLLRRVS